MPIFVYRCECGNTFERLVARDAPPPECPECASATRKIPAGPSIGRVASAQGAGDVAVPWRGTVAKGAEGMQREVTLRENIVTKGREYPGNPGSAAASPSKD
ncbi:MAG: zinc ribbon domain-containing protein [Pseudonocardia sp.]|nr:zinc ribbon domain-containing protein [Pseudonocardia sp.]